MTIASNMFSTYDMNSELIEETLWMMQDTGDVKIKTLSDDEGEYCVLEYKFKDGSSLFYNEDCEDWFQTYQKASVSA